MDKKIIAVALVLVLMVTAFVGCGQKYKTTKIGNGEYLLVTDAEGNTFINDKNQIAVVVTDTEGEIQTFEDGEEQTYLIQLDGEDEFNGAVLGIRYKMNLLEGWSIVSKDRIAKDGTDNNCYIQFTKSMEFKDGDNFGAYLERIDEASDKLVEGMEKEGLKLNVEKKKDVIIADNIACTAYIYTMYDENNELVHYAEEYYFAEAKTSYKLSYICKEAVGYDETFNFENYLRENFTFMK